MSYATCPFKITSILAVDEGSQRRCHAKSGQHEGLLQQSPFKPQGAFKTRQSMNVMYFIDPHKEWFEMSRYKSFLLNDVRYNVSDFVHVDSGSSSHWVAKILEIRASDECHVYMRVYWMYSPNDLPNKAAVNHGRAVKSSQSYNQGEMIVSNHMDIINVLSVVRGAPVQQIYGAHDNVRSPCLHWRQAFDYPTKELSSIDDAPEYKSHTRNLLPSECTVQGELSPAPEEQTPTQSRLDEVQRLHSGSGEPQVTRIDSAKANIRKIRRRSRRRYQGRPCELNAENKLLSQAHVGVRPVLQPTSKSSLVHPPTPLQHSLLAELQGILEVACYDYTRRTMPDTIRHKGWDCAESVELNQWTFEMQKLNFVGKKGSDNIAMDVLLRSVARIRHTAVHRRRVGVPQIDKFFTDAVTLLEFLGDEERRQAVDALRQETTILLACGTRERRKEPGDTLRKIATKRAHLQTTEKMNGKAA